MVRVPITLQQGRGYSGRLMRHVAVLAVLLGAGLLASGFGAARPSTDPFDPGDLVVAGAGLVVYTPAGYVTNALALGSGPTGFQLRAAAAGPPGRIYAGDDTPVLRMFESDGSHGGIGEYPDGFVVTALDSNAAHVYVAVSDGGLLHNIYRVTHAGVHQFPFVVESRVTALDIASDDCSLFYATTTRGIRRLDVCARGNSQLVTNLAARDIALLPDSTLIVVPSRGRAILRLAPDGHILRRYQTPRVKSWRSVAVARGAASLWAATPAGVVYRFALSSGKVEGRRIKTILSRLAALDVIDAPEGVAPPLGPAKQEGSLELDGVKTLTGEGLVDIANGRPNAPQQCTAPNPTTMEFSPPAGSETAAIGPYPGEFSSTLTGSIGRQTIKRPSGILGVNVGRVFDLSGNFEIRASDGRRVQGSLLLPKKAGNANTGACLVFQNKTFPHSILFPPTVPLTGYFRNIHARQLGYRATIQTGGRTYFDEGDTSLYTDEYYLSRADLGGLFAGSASRHTQSFYSRLQSVDDEVDSKSERERHVIVVRGGRKSLTFRIAWPRKTDAFTVTDIGLVKASQRHLAGAGKLKPGKLKPGGIRVSTTRKGKTLRVVVTKLKPGEVRFAVAATRLTGATTVTTSLENPSGS